MKAHFAYQTLAILGLCLSGHAGIITGRVVNSSGSGVAGVNISVDAGGATVLNGGTDLNGFFTTTITPDSVYNIKFSPPTPPTTTLLPKVMSNVVVTGTVNLGNVALQSGLALSGRTVHSVSGAGIAGVNIDIQQNGLNVVVTNDLTDASGNFLLAVPMGTIEVRFDASVLGAPLLASKEVELTQSSNFSMGNVPLKPGFVVSGSVVRASNGSAVVDADVDAVDNATGEKIYTPSDNTNSSGFVDFVLPAGNFQLEFCAPLANKLVTKVLPSLNVAGTTSFGTVALSPGVILSGTILAFDGQAHANVDIDLLTASTGAIVPLCLDKTAANGTYAVVVPTGTFEVQFEPPYSLPLGSDIKFNVSITQDTNLNGTLPSCPFHTIVGSASQGSGGFFPLIGSAGGAPRMGNKNYRAVVTRGLGGAQCWMVYRAAGPGSVQVPMPMAFGGLKAPNILSGPNGAPGVGNTFFSLPIGTFPGLAGVTNSMRALIKDQGAVGGLCHSAIMQATICP